MSLHSDTEHKADWLLNIAKHLVILSTVLAVCE